MNSIQIKKLLIECGVLATQAHGAIEGLKISRSRLSEKEIRKLKNLSEFAVKELEMYNTVLFEFQRELSGSFTVMDCFRKLQESVDEFDELVKETTKRT
jgi:hypothetical protein